MLEILKGKEQKVEAFRRSYKCKSELSIENKDTVLYLIDKHAYNHDAMWRTLKKTDESAYIDENNKAIVIRWIQNEIEAFIKMKPENQSKFDEWHESICNKLVDKINNNVLSGYEPVCIGKAQKIVNMTFKYLSSLDNAEIYEKVFDCCHIPLDVNILNWYYLNVKIGVPKSQYKVWSKLVYHDYKTIQDDFRKYCEKNSCVPLELEWKIF